MILDDYEIGSFIVLVVVLGAFALKIIATFWDDDDGGI